MGVKQLGFVSLWTWLVLNVSVQKEESNWAWPSRANILIVQMPEQPSSTTRVETSLPIAQWLVHLCIRPFCLMLPLAHTEGSSASPASSQCHSCWAGKCPTARRKRYANKCMQVLSVQSPTWLCTQRSNFRNNVVLLPADNQGDAPFS